MTATLARRGWPCDFAGFTSARSQSVLSREPPSPCAGRAKHAATSMAPKRAARIADDAIEIAEKIDV